MQPDRFARGRVLMEQSRYDLAATEITARLADAPDDPEGYILLALCQHFASRPAALETARRAVELAPDDSRAHLAVSLAEAKRGNLAEAEAAVRRAIELNSWNAGYFGQLAAVHIAQYRWADALAAADEGLAFDPDDEVCLNNRAVALTNLGRRDEAARTLDGTLEKHPEDAFTHANRGWTLLHENEPKQAVGHFREALRLDPNSAWAKRGMLEALRARSWFYRRVLQFTLWMSRFPPRVQLGLTLGLIALVWVLDGLGRWMPAAEPVFTLLVFGYAAFVAVNWFAKHVTNVLLLFDRDGRVLLDRTEKWVSVVCVGLLAAVLLLAAAAAVTRSLQAVGVAVFVFLAAVHFASVMNIPPGRYRWYGMAASVLVVGLFSWERVERMALLGELAVLEKMADEHDQRTRMFNNSDPHLKSRQIARNAQRMIDRVQGLPDPPDPPDPEQEAHDRRERELLRERRELEAGFRRLKSRGEGVNTLQTVAAFLSIGGLVLHTRLTARAQRVRFE